MTSPSPFAELPTDPSSPNPAMGPTSPTVQGLRPGALVVGVAVIVFGLVGLVDAGGPTEVAWWAAPALAVVVIATAVMGATLRRLARGTSATEA